MQDLVDVTGMVLKQEPIGEYDRRLLILTKERGKISCFAKGSRKMGSRLMAATNPFSFGIFHLFEGRSAYSLNGVEISNYFEEFREDLNGAMYGMYFLEVSDYFSLENMDGTNMLKLLYQSLRALSVPSLDNYLVRAVFEIKAIVLNGEYPGIPTDEKGNIRYSESLQYAVNFIALSSIEKLYTFTLKEEVLNELIEVAGIYMRRFTDKHFNSLDMLETLYLPS